MLSCFVSVSVRLLAAGLPARDGLETTPNILFILADDLGYGDISTYDSPLAADRRLLTPHVAKLSAEGMQFTDAYAGYSVCAPSRRTLMTGFHTGHFATGDSPTMLTNRSTTVAAILGRNGYDTRLIGKWGLDGNFRVPRAPNVGFPTLQGFQSFYGQSDQWQCHDYYPQFQFNNTANLTIPQNRGSSVASCGPDHARCVWSADLWTTDAINWITAHGTDAAAVQQKPWFLYLAYTAPHAGSVGSVGEDDVPAPRVGSGPYAAKRGKWPDVEVHFATAVTEIDAAVGAVVKAVDESGQGKRTVIFFSSDNGAHQEGGHQYQFFNSSGYLNGFKRSIHDGGHRAAFIARWTGKITASSISHHQLCFYDFLPTALDLAGVAPSHLPPKIDGHSFAPTLLGKQQVQPPFIYHEFNGPQDPVFHGVSFAKGFSQNIRMGNWSGVAVCSHPPCGERADTTFFLYDMSTDQAQRLNVAAAHPATVAAISKIMVEQYDKTYDPNGVMHPPPPPPSPPPSGYRPWKSPCSTGKAVTSGVWLGQKHDGHLYHMNVSEGGKSATLAVTDECCAWVRASATISDGKIHAAATDSSGKLVVSPVGTISADGCTIEWSERWAPWRKQAPTDLSH